MADKRPQTINEEAGLGPEWVPIDSAPIIPGKPMPGGDVPADGSSKYLQGSLPPGYQHDSTFVDTAYKGSTPQLSLMPLGIQGSPASNAAIQSTSTIISQQVVAATPPSSSGGGGGGGTDTDIISAVNPQTFGSQDVSSFIGGQTPTNPTNFVRPTTAGEVIISYRLNSNTNPPAFSAPWTPLNLNPGAIGTLGWQKVTPTTPVTDGWSVPGTQAWATAMVGLASSGTPTFTSLASSGSTLPVNIAGVAISAGVPIIIFVEFAANSFFSPSLNITDSLGNTYVWVGDAVGKRPAGTQQAQISIWYCDNPVGGTATISFAGNSALVNTAIAVYKVTGLSSGTGTYTFQSSDANEMVPFRGAVNVAATLPNPAFAAGWQTLASNNGAGTVTISSAGPLLNLGSSSVVLPPGTFAWLFSDGTNYWCTRTPILPVGQSPVAHKFLTAYDFTTGLFTAAQPSASDLTNGTTGSSGGVVLANSPTLTGVVNLPTVTLASTISNYNGIGTVSNGVPAEYATVDLTAQTAAKTTTTLYAVPAAGAGQYRVSWNAKVTTAAGVSSTLGPLTIVYTDPDGIVQTITAAAQSSAGAIETSDTGNTTTTVMLGVPMMLNCKASTNITYAFAYASNAANVMAYNLHIKVEAM